MKGQGRLGPEGKKRRMLDALPTAAAVWFGGTALLLTFISVATGSTRFVSNEQAGWRLDQSISLGAIGLILWVVFGVPATFVFGGPAVYQTDAGAWAVIVGVVSAAFACGAVWPEFSYWERVTGPPVYALLALIPATCLALMMGMITVGAGFWLALGAIVGALISFATFGYFGVLVFSPLLVLFLIAITQS